MKLGLKLVATAALMTLVLWWVGDEQASGPEKIANVMAGANLAVVLVCLLVATVDRLLMVFKWKLLLKSRDVDLPFLSGMRIYCSSMMWGLFLPTTLGADAIRAGLTIRSGLPGNEVVASMVLERMVGFLSALLMGLLGIVLLSSLTELAPRWASLWWLVGLGLLGASAVVALSFSRTLFDRLHGMLPRWLTERRVVRRLRDLHATYVGYSANGGAIRRFAMLTLAENWLSILFCWLTALALHVDVDLLFVAGALPLALLVAGLPVSVSGLGVFEGVFAALMLMAGVGAQQAISIALLGRLMQIGSWVPWWIAQILETRELRPPEATVPEV